MTQRVRECPDPDTVKVGNMAFKQNFGWLAVRNEPPFMHQADSGADPGGSSQVM
jgi:hypothetical protein